MMPPTSIDGTDITGASIDGTDVQEITVDGDTVFTAGPDLPASTVAHFDATQLSLADGDPVNTWPDQISGNDATDVNPPTFKSSGIGGLGSIEFDGSNDEMTAPIGTYSQPITFAVVMNPDNVNSAVLNSDGSNIFEVQVRPTSSKDEHFIEDASSLGRIDTDPTNPIEQVEIFAVNFPTVTVRRNGTDITIQGTPTFSGNPNNVNLEDLIIGSRGGTQFFQGELSELLVYDSFLTTSEINDEETRLSNKYGISI